MKKIHFLKAVNKIFLLLMFSGLQLLAWAQDSTVSSRVTKTTTTTTTSFEVQPWMWMAGGVVLLLIIIALVRGNGRKEEVHTTIIKDRT